MIVGTYVSFLLLATTFVHILYHLINSFVPPLRILPNTQFVLLIDILCFPSLPWHAFGEVAVSLFLLGDEIAAKLTCHTIAHLLQCQ